MQCIICKSKNIKILYPDTLGNKLPEFGYNFSPNSQNTYQMVSCGECSHIFSFPIPDDIYSAYIEVVDHAYLKNELQRIDTAQKVMQYILRCKKQGGVLLDVGCATGDFLRVARNYFAVEGLELSQWGAKIALERGLKIHQCLLGDIKGAEKYDIVTLWGVIEHFQNPLEEMHEIHRLLKPNGIVCIWTGDASSWIAKLLGKRWWYYMGQHIQVFTEKSLDVTLKKAGLERVKIQTYPYVMTLKSVAASLQRYRALGWIANALLNNDFLGKYCLTLKISGEMFAIYKKA